MSLYIVHVIYSSNLTKNFNFLKRVEKKLKRFEKFFKKVFRKFLEKVKKEIEFFTQSPVTDFNNYLLLLLGI